MKTFAIACAAVALFAGTAAASDVNVSAATLDDMGLGQMQQLSDEEGMDVRGKGMFEDFFSGVFDQLHHTAVGFGDTLSGLGDTFQFNFGNQIDFDFSNFNFHF